MPVLQARGFMADPDVRGASRTGAGAGDGAAAVVGIGASAGALEALRRFFSHVPAQTGVAWIVVVHLPPESPSGLADLLQPHVRLPVRQVRETVVLEPDCVYVIPPGANLNAVDTHLRLSPLEAEERLRAPVDHFFRTLAATHDGNSVGVILTGTGADGSLGLKAISEKNGFTVVQDPAEAEHAGMPQSALSTGLVDEVLPLDDIPTAVLRFAHTRPRDRQAGLDGVGDSERDYLLGRVLRQVRAQTGRDFAGYRRSTLLRRIQRRMQIRAVEELGAYMELLWHDVTEARRLADDLLIPVTSFFRDTEIWAALETQVVPRLFETADANAGVRVWSAGCATGEEAYSLAILLLEEAKRRPAPTPVQVFASDLHLPSLERARQGLYPGDVGTDVSAERLRRFFHREDGGYRVRKEVRERVIFAPHDFLTDPPFSQLDLIACRNVLIYLEEDVHARVLAAFHYALRPGGYLLLGKGERVEETELFRLEGSEPQVYRRQGAGRARVPLPSVRRARIAADEVPGSDLTTARGPGTPLHLHLDLLEEYAAPSILVAPDGRVLHLSERAGRYLRQSGGETETQAIRLVREELRLDLRAALHAAGRGRERTRSPLIPVRIGAEEVAVTMDVRPARGARHDGYVLVIFEEWPTGVPDSPREGADEVAPGYGATHNLEAQLDRSEDQLHASIQEYEGSQEELRASNEELQSANEELRSMLEELETSREELRSINEELQTANEDNRQKVEELAQLAADLQNLLASTEIATLFLDREMRILRFTPRASELFNVRASDRGRPLADLTNRLGYAELGEDAAQVLDTLLPVEREVAGESGRWYLTHVLPYRSRENRIDGVVITFVDITVRKRAERALLESEDSLRDLNQTLEQRVAARSAELERESAARREVLRRLVTAEEEERKRISRELHDRMGQHLTGLLLGLRSAQGESASPRLTERLQELERLAGETAGDVQSMAVELRPPALDALGLVAALENHLAEWSDRHGIDHDLHARGLGGVRLSREVEITLYRVVQEGLTNVLKHASATRVDLILELREGVVRLVLEDNGAGFDVEQVLTSAEKARRLGVRGMQERVALLGGELQIESSPGHGTTLYVRLPALEGGA
jgi:two-component system, chemotaxis family, CheB/CheR fusion protein